jgi:hypothetical protein
MLAGCGRMGFGLVDAGGVPDAALDGPVDAAPDADVTAGLVLRYPMEDDPSNSILFDVSGLGHHAKCSTGMCFTRVAGAIGQAMQLDGKGWLEVPEAPWHHLAAFTYAIWILRPGTLMGNTVLSKPQPAGVGATVELAVFENGTWFCTDADPGPAGEDCIYSTAVIPPVWTHVALVWDGTLKTLYIDGVSVGTASPLTTVDGGLGLFIGVDYENMTFGPGFDGALDELRIYDRALDAAAIRELATLP